MSNFELELLVKTEKRNLAEKLRTDGLVVKSFDPWENDYKEEDFSQTYENITPLIGGDERQYHCFGKEGASLDQELLKRIEREFSGYPEGKISITITI